MASVPGLHLGNPELSLRRYRIRRITVTGRISGDVASVRDVPTGAGVAPRAVALTFDDGPWPVQTRSVLRVLERYHAPATFFMVGYLVDRYPGIVWRVARAGMRIGDHSWDHPISPPLADLSDERVAEEIGKAKQALRTLGIRSALFRPPGGSYDDGVVQQARLQSMRVVTWNVDPRDWVPGSTSGQIVRRVLGAVRPGSIVLLHDGGGDRSATIRALPRIIRGIRKMGLRLVEVPRLA
jgi:peptidoglycan/xylan/chitin deacetylase (PgdA/CDA1 family)